MEGREHAEPGFVNVLKSQESIPPAYVAWRPGTTTLLDLGCCGVFSLESSPGLLKRLQIRAQHFHPI